MVVLELDTEEAKVIRAKGMKDMKHIRMLKLPTIDKWHDAYLISDGTWQELLCFRKYMINYKNKCSEAQIVAMTVESWAMVNMDELELVHSLNKGAAVTPSGHNPAPPSIINTGNVMPADIDAYSFLKYVNVKLSGRTGVLNFDDNLCVQSKRFNIFLRPSKDINKLLGVAHITMDPDCVSAMGTALHSKMSQVDTIDEKYKDAHNLRQTTTDRYVFLQLLIQQVHPLLAIKQSLRWIYLDTAYIMICTGTLKKL